MKSKLIQKLSLMTPEKAYEFDLIMCNEITNIAFKIYSIWCYYKKIYTTCRHTRSDHHTITISTNKIRKCAEGHLRILSSYLLYPSGLDISSLWIMPLLGIASFLETFANGLEKIYTLKLTENNIHLMLNQSEKYKATKSTYKNSSNHVQHVLYIYK